jgi:hypothetical protein
LKIHCFLNEFLFIHLKASQPQTETTRKKHEKLEATTETDVHKELDADVMWINAMVGRVLFDILKNPYWVEKLQERLQRKLSTIKVCKFCFSV